MKKTLSIVLFLMLSVGIYAQKQVTKFLGIPVDGSKVSMIQKLKAKGFVYNSFKDCLEGEFNGEDVELLIVTNNNKVWRIAVVDKAYYNEGQIRIRYNRLCQQFANNPKYKEVSAEELSEDEDISYEITVNDKQYGARFAQLPDDNDILKRHVWFTIIKRYREYTIAIYYDNEFNHANGEEL